MTRLTEHTVLARTRAQDLKSVRKLNAWGSELTDVSIVKKLSNVEVLSLSVNSICSLQDFAHCNHLQELYLRKNNIADLSEIRHLQDLPKLRNLWLADNPCAETKQYRLTVIRALPQLQKLDNITIHPEELETAQIHGTLLESIQISPQEEQPVEVVHFQNSVISESKVTFVSESTTCSKSTVQHSRSVETISPKTEEPKYSPSAEYIPPLNQRAESDQNFDAVPYQYPTPPVEVPNITSPKQSFETEDDSMLERSADTSTSERVSSCSFTSASKSTPRSVSSLKLLPKGGKNRNANILSAVLCLIKELDWPSLEVVDTAVHCLMEEVEAEQAMNIQGSGTY